MSAAISFAFFLSLLFSCTAQPLPLKEGTTLGALLESPVWGALLNTTNMISGQVGSTLENWTDYVPQLLTEPFMAGFQSEDAISRKDTVSGVAEITAFPNDLQKTAYHAYDAFMDEFNTLREEAQDIIGDVPNWLTLENLKKVDLSKLDFSHENLKELVSEVINVPEEESRRIAAFFDSASKLVPTHGYKLGTQAARLTSNAKGLVKSYLPKLAAKVVSSVQSAPPMIFSSLQAYYPKLVTSLQSYSPMLLSSLQSYSPMLLSSLQSYYPVLLSSLQSLPPMITSLLTSNLGSVMPFFSMLF